MPAPRKTISHGFLYIARVNRDRLTGQISLTVGRDKDIFETKDGDEFVTFVTPAPLFEDES
jgi:hypothetical protein